MVRHTGRLPRKAGAFHYKREHRKIKGLGQKVHGAKPQGLNHAFNPALGRHHNHAAIP